MYGVTLCVVVCCGVMYVTCGKYVAAKYVCMTVDSVSVCCGVMYDC